MKLPVFQTFGNAFRFAVTNFFTCFRLAWLPFTMLFAAQQSLQWFVLSDIHEHFPMAPEHNPRAMFEIIFETLSRFATIQAGMLVLQAIVIAAVAVSFHRIILFGDRREGSVINFAFGRTEFLYMLMAAGFTLITLSVLATVLVPAVFAVAGGDFAGLVDQFRNFPESMPVFVRSGRFGVLMFAYMIAWLLTGFVMIRLAVWPPSVVATGRLGTSEPWNLTRGNVLRFIGLFLLTAIVCWILVASLAIAAFTGGGLEAIKSLQSLDHEGSFEMQRHMMLSMTPYLPLFYLVSMIVYVFGTSLVVGLISYSYKALKGYDAGTPIPDGA